VPNPEDASPVDHVVGAGEERLLDGDGSEAHGPETFPARVAGVAFAALVGPDGTTGTTRPHGPGTHRPVVRFREEAS
jgi:hypothetical protein